MLLKLRDNRTRILVFIVGSMATCAVTARAGPGLTIDVDSRGIHVSFLHNGDLLFSIY